MKDVTALAMDTLMRHAPVWATSMAGRTKVFMSEETPTAHVSGSYGRFKIVINPALSGDMAFILMHEVAHIFRQDITSMHKHPGVAQEINIAADCIINDGLVKIGLQPPKSLASGLCWGRDIYKMNCASKSINDLMKLEQQEGKGQASAPGNVTENGQSMEEGDVSSEGGKKTSEEKGVGDDFSGYIGLGGGQVFGDPRQLARNVVSYARRMFFETGFKSKNMSTKMDWRRNRSAFALRTDVAIPRTTVGEYGHNSPGPLVNLVLDTSGSMDQSWVATAASIAQEIGKAGLDYDLWLTPTRRKARNAKVVIDALLDGSSMPPKALHEQSNIGVALSDIEGPHPSRAIRLPRPLGRGANELREIGHFATEDPVVWIYIGDYLSSMDYELFLDKNFLHVPMVEEGYEENDWSKDVFKVMRDKSLPRWLYEV